MIFSLILLLKKALGIEPETILNLLNPYTLLGFLCGGAVIYWFTGASIQAVTTGAYRAVEYIKKNIKLDDNATLQRFHGKFQRSGKDLYAVCPEGDVQHLYRTFLLCLGLCLLLALRPMPQSECSRARVFHQLP